MRFVGGIVVLCLNNDPNSTGLIIAALGLLGAGVFPLIVASLGLFRIMYGQPIPLDITHPGC